MVDTRKYNAKRNDYTKRTYFNVALRLNREKDSDIINWMNAQPNRTEYLRELVKNDMIAFQRKFPEAVIEDGQIVTGYGKNHAKNG